jgi:hypothetical protein
MSLAYIVAGLLAGALYAWATVRVGAKKTPLPPPPTSHEAAMAYLKDRPGRRIDNK